LCGHITIIGLIEYVYFIIQHNIKGNIKDVFTWRDGYGRVYLKEWIWDRVWIWICVNF